MSTMTPIGGSVRSPTQGQAGETSEERAVGGTRLRSMELHIRLHGSVVEKRLFTC